MYLMPACFAEFHQATVTIAMAGCPGGFLIYDIVYTMFMGISYKERKVYMKRICFTILRAMLNVHGYQSS